MSSGSSQSQYTEVVWKTKMGEQFMHLIIHFEEGLICRATTNCGDVAAVGRHCLILWPKTFLLSMVA
jgi:hypothetical protein